MCEGKKRRERQEIEEEPRSCEIRQGDKVCCTRGSRRVNKRKSA